MYSKVEIITPELAKLYLERNIDNNRKLCTKNISLYASAMKSGDWQLTSQGISFNESGHLTDGQHRLMAIIKAGVPVKMYVTYGEPDGSIIHDRGRGRSINDVMNMSGDIKVTPAHVSLTNCIFNFAVGTCANVPDSTKMRFIACNESFLDEIINASRKGANHAIAKTAPAQSAAFFGVLSGISKETMKKFFYVLNSGFQESSSQSAAIVARKFIENGWRKEFDYYNYSARRRVFDVVSASLADFDKGIARHKIYSPGTKNAFQGSIDNIKSRYL